MFAKVRPKDLFQVLAALRVKSLSGACVELREVKILLPTLGAQTFRPNKALMLLNCRLSAKEMPNPLKEVGLRGHL